MADTKRRDKLNRVLNRGEFQRKDGKYEYKYIDSFGKRRTVYSWKLTPTDKVPDGKKCDLSLREMEKKIKRDIEDGIDTYSADRKTLNDFFETYIEGKVELKDSTRENYIYMYNRYVRDDIGQRKLTTIKYSDIKKFYMHLIHTIGFKPNSMETIHTILHPIFTTAVRDGYIRINPTDNVMKEIKKSHDWEKPKRHALTKPQQEAFVEFIKNSKQYKHWLPLFTFCLGTGMRVGEVIGLQWKNCNLDMGFINVQHNMLYRKNKQGKCEFHISTTKTVNGIREIPMFDEVKEALLTIKKQQERDGKCRSVVDGYSDFVFSNRYNEVYSPASLNRAISRIIRDYNKEDNPKPLDNNGNPVLLPHFSMHNLRHTFCTRLCEAGVNIKVVQEVMGHHDIETTMNIYNEATKDFKKQSFEELQGKIKIA